ncbi:hypothetical protein JG687_00009835 [Phytophthora cactorum]|uniref:Uncharacterized protein n=1 Tax=Phytophthora cactorum TaxID=29920 RepID=A0A8T1UBL5_9STRA|nr:hypothetical protein JG687_00009835 [Phytophthora cactorum]
MDEFRTIKLCSQCHQTLSAVRDCEYEAPETEEMQGRGVGPQPSGELRGSILGSRCERGHQHGRTAQERGARTRTHGAVQEIVDNRNKNVETRKSPPRY